MIRTKVSVTKKRPAAEQYSSDAFSATIEVELPDTVYSDGNGDLKRALAKLFKEVEGQVDAQMGNGKAPARYQELDSVSDRTPGSSPPRNGSQRRRQGSSGNGREDANSYDPEPATQRQIGYLLSLAKRSRGLSPSQITALVRRATGKSKVYDLSRDEASRLIGELKNAS